MSIPSSPDQRSQQIASALKSLANAKQALSRQDTESATIALARFRKSPVGNTVRQLESDLLELRLQALQDTTKLAGRCAELYSRHVGKDNEDAFLSGAAQLIRRYVNPEAALSWLEEMSEPNRFSTLGRGRTAASYLQLLRETGCVDQARAQAKDFLKNPSWANAHRSVWEQTLLTLRGQRPDKQIDLDGPLQALAQKLPHVQRLRLWNIAAASRVLVASTTDVASPTTDSLPALKLALSYHCAQATLQARQQAYAAAADHLEQARNISVQIRGESLESLELDLQQFEMRLLGKLAQPTDDTWLSNLRSVAAQVGKIAQLEHRLANVWRKAGYQQLALEQYAQVAQQYPNDPWGLKANYQLAVADEDDGKLDSAYARYLNIAKAEGNDPACAMLCLIGAYRCATRQNDEARQTDALNYMRTSVSQIGDLNEALLMVRQLRDDGLGGLSDTLLTQCQAQYESQKANLSSVQYLGATHQLVRRLYAAERYDDALALINSISSSYWNNPNIAWGHLAGCLHYACLSWLALNNIDQAVGAAGSGAAALSTRPSQSAHVDLAVARVYEETGAWNAAGTLFDRIISKAPFSSAAMKAKLRLARRAWQTGQLDEARLWAMSLLMDGKLNRKDPDLAEAYWSAYGMAASKQGAPTAEDNLVYPTLSAQEAIKRLRSTRIARLFHLG